MRMFDTGPEAASSYSAISGPYSQVHSLYDARQNQLNTFGHMIGSEGHMTNVPTYQNFASCAMTSTHATGRDGFADNRDESVSLPNTLNPIVKASPTMLGAQERQNIHKLSTNTAKRPLDQDYPEGLDLPTFSSDAVSVYDESRFEQLIREEHEFEEEVDEEFSDEECQDEIKSFDTNPDDATHKLLQFAEMVNGDIKKFFGNKKEEDSCDIYEDKWTSGKSGRELYYADIMRIAQGGDIDDPVSPNKTDKENKVYTGKVDKSAGLGPLETLFDSVMKTDKTREKKVNAKKSVKRLKSHEKKHESLVPMQKRNLPQSFWNEPMLTSNSDKRTISKGQGQGKHKCDPRTPDFSDLLDSWEGAPSQSN